MTRQNLPEVETLKLRSTVQILDAEMLDLIDVTDSLDAIPHGLYIGANRYDTGDGTAVLHLWNSSGESFDVIWHQPGPQRHIHEPYTAYELPRGDRMKSKTMPRA